MLTQNLFKKTIYISFALFLVMLLNVASSTAQDEKAAGGQTEKSLYERLGGYDAIAAVTDDFIGRLTTDPQLKRFFVGFSTDSKHRIRQLIVDQICNATGGPCLYIGRDMKTTHAGIGITEGDWQTAVKLLVATLDKFNVPQKEKDELLNLVSGLKNDIVEK